MGTDIFSAGRPESGGIDVIETLSVTTSYTNHLHGPTTSGGTWQLGNSGAVADLSADFHTYSVTKSKDAITVSLDSRTVGWIRVYSSCGVPTSSTIGPGQMAESGNAITDRKRIGSSTSSTGPCAPSPSSCSESPGLSRYTDREWA